MPEAATSTSVSVAEYLAGERLAEVRHEYVNGEVFAMADRSDKFYAYRKLPSLMEYVLVAQDEPRIEVYRRTTGWDLEVYGPGQRPTLAAIGAELDLDAVYAGILALSA